ncbi:MAG: hypothetical protein AB1467_05940 [Candidatus Diapherotrites archaeon]
MGFYIDYALNNFRRSFSPRFLGYNFLAGIIVSVLSIFLIAVFVVLPAVATFLSFKFSVAALWIYLLLFFVFIVIMAFAEALFLGFKLNFSRALASGKKIELGSAWKALKPRLVTAFGVKLVVNLVVAIAVILWLIPVAIYFLNAIKEFSFLFSALPFTSAQTAFALSVLFPAFLLLFLKVFAWLLLGAIIFGVIYLVLLPFLIVLNAVPYFEDIGIIDSFKRAYWLGRKNYFKNYFFAVAYFIFSLAAVIVLLIVGGILNLVSFVFSFFLLAVAIAAIIRFIINVLFGVWAQGYGSLFFLNVYAFDSSAKKPALKPAKKPVKRKARPKARK